MRLGSAILLVLALPGAAAALRFQVAPGPGQQVEFESRAPLETFRGRTQEVSGTFELDPAELADSIVVEMRVELASLDTGLELRNQHMRDNHLQTDQFPLAVFRGGRVRSAARRALGVGAPLEFVLTGELLLHGVRQPLEIPITIQDASAGGPTRLRVTTHFEVKLSDHGIARPKMLVLKLDEVQRVHVELLATAAE